MLMDGVYTTKDFQEIGIRCLSDLWFDDVSPLSVDCSPQLTLTRVLDCNTDFVTGAGLTNQWPTSAINSLSFIAETGIAAFNTSCGLTSHPLSLESVQTSASILDHSFLSKPSRTGFLSYLRQIVRG